MQGLWHLGLHEGLYWLRDFVVCCKTLNLRDSRAVMGFSAAQRAVRRVGSQIAAAGKGLLVLRV